MGWFFVHTLFLSPSVFPLLGDNGVVVWVGLCCGVLYRCGNNEDHCYCVIS
jgi:hypothetical protein